MNSIATVWFLLSPSERLAAGMLFGWMVLGMALEMLGIGLVVPALSLLAGNAEAVSGSAAGGLHKWLGGPSHRGLLMIGAAAFTLVYAVKTAVLLFINWQQHRFVARLNADLSQRLFSVYMRQPWSFHLQRSSAVLIRNLDTISSITEAVGWALVLVAESLVLIGIALLLGWFEPIGAVGVGLVTGAAAILLDRATRRRVELWGRLLQEHAARRMKYVQEGLQGVKEALLHGRQRIFVSQFAAANEACARMSAKKMFIGNLPRLWFELVAVVSLAVLVGIMAAEGRPMRAMVPIVGLFAAAAFRILPSVNRLATALHALRFSANSLETLRDELSLEVSTVPVSTADTRLPFAREIFVDEVSYRYQEGVEDALKSVNLRISRGTAIGLVGTSGAGKSTLVDVILGVLPPSRGRVLIDHVDIATNPAAWQQMVGYVSQSIYLVDDSIRRNVAFGVADDSIDDQAVRRALSIARLNGFVDSLPHGVETRVGEHGVRLSGGQRQRIGIARALYHDPAVVILDEATSALDLATERQIMGEIASIHGEKTLIIVSHRTSTVSDCDVVYQIEKGVLRQADVMADAYPPGMSRTPSE
jgi:ABC-type multidrug transport system fused ATPase/permease subunit